MATAADVGLSFARKDHHVYVCLRMKLKTSIGCSVNPRFVPAERCGEFAALELQLSMWS
jgi:hypothetical protein